MGNPSRFDYLRHRPFLVVDVIGRPAAHVRTERAGWRDANKLVLSDHPRVVNRISDRTMRTATVIIDILRDAVVKNRYKNDASAFDDEVLANCKSKFGELIESAKLSSKLSAASA